LKSVTAPIVNDFPLLWRDKCWKWSHVSRNQRSNQQVHWC